MTRKTQQTVDVNQRTLLTWAFDERLATVGGVAVLLATLIEINPAPRLYWL
ncbi:MAG TPA: hypothetical protein VMY42_05090 [Thermoguttaceae bacterium]|nr:hypothetical protein [Thermoguttaceae bacterium]